ncbi:MULTISPECIES: outer membrane channel protein TolC [unclassified Salinivibrio]|uniref:outer membrane channel protein TolC n=1 Tax=unclassified Salinivibrio TaxID=2636825 RepID=UPI00084CA328|nr:MULTISPECIES: outer membrane channel protein TolC [unclassified Salinivibrio]ODP99770.1 outer membrane channel protein TolC [Salinivibrio sp. DV]PCE68129.1 outer membrane channel protein TolC [Salinivibrio sp. YCSC6]QCF34982.1 outer membrane channel protein TolC [Salinivibrio sp. YCSC6]
MKKLLPLALGLALGSLSSVALADDLAQIYQQAKQSDPTLNQAAAERDAAFSAVDATRGTLLPQIGLNAGYSITRNDSNDQRDNNTTSADISLSQQIFKRDSWINLDISEMQARQLDAVYAAQQQGLMLRVAQAYFDVLRAMDKLEFVKAEKAAVGRQLEQTKQRFEVGLSAITDVHDAQAQYDAVLADEILAQNALTNSYEGLREITGEAPRDLRVLDTARFSASKPQQQPAALVETAEEKNLKLLASRIARDTAKEQIKLAESGHLPTLTFSAKYGMTDVDNQHTPGSVDSNEGTAGLTFSLPLFTGGSTSANVEKAQYNYVAASESLEATFRSTVKDVRAFYNDINASIGALRAYEQTVISARSALEATEAGFEVGTRTIVDVLDATRRLYDANRNLSNARYDYILSRLQLRQAVGTLSEQDLLEINKGLIEKR